MEDNIKEELIQISIKQRELLYNSIKINEQLQNMRGNILVAHLIIFGIISFATYLYFI